MSEGPSEDSYEDPFDRAAADFFAAVEDARPFGLRFFTREAEDGPHDVLYVGNELVVAPPGLLTTPLERLGHISEPTRALLVREGGFRCDDGPTDPGGDRTRLGRVEVWRFVDDDDNPRDARRVLAALERSGDTPADTVTVHRGFVAHQKMHPGADPELPTTPCELQAPDASAVAGAGVRVAVLDSGCTVAAGPDLLAGATGDPEVLVVDGHADPTKRVLARSAAHGTFIASLIKQLAPRAEVHVTRVLDTLGVTTEARVVRALGRLPGDTHVVSLSLGAYASELARGRELADGHAGGTPPLLLGAAVLDLLDRGVAVVASAGNDRETMPTFPAAYPGVVGVAALEHDRPARWERSNHGDWVRACTVGVDLNGLFVRGDEDPYWETDGQPESWRDHPSFARCTGTSFAAPLVAATIAARLSQLPAGTPPRVAADDVLNAARPGPPGCGVLVDVPLPHGM